MSKLEELIQELCPNGIQYHLIGDICDVLTGGEAPPESIKEKEPQGEYIYPIYSNGLGDNALWGYSKTFRIDKPAVTFSSIGTIGFPTLREAKFTPIIRLKVIYPKDANKLNICFLKYALEIVQFEKQKSSVANVNASMIKNIKIPVPPLEVQQEIVRILDDFTAKTAELQAELNKEYEARKKQYEYYRDQTLTKESLSTNICDKVDDVLQNIDLMCSNLNIELHNDVDSRVKQIELYKSAIENYFDTGKILSLQQEDMENVIMLIQHLFGCIKLTLNEACLSIKDGMHNLPKNTSEVGDYPIISAQNINNDKIDYFAKRYVDIDTYEKENKRTNVTQNDVLLTIVATIGRTAIVKEDRPVLLQRSVCVLKPNSILRPSYLKYWLDTSNVQSYMQNNAHGSAQAGLYLKQVGAIEILIPSIEIQDKIVSALDNIRNISNNLQSKISSELESRQKQYEYYRDKLLTFKELNESEVN